ncbi:ATP-binding protein [Ideonella azotifigens]|uniref:histidine kinase n=1 Tax=Ideonella azotifigens TaxID=513160 RepID=A0ABP3VCN0_9BURK|nr:ATP-binding protein [Ideonella azotifigens]MCD2344869.1 ATP-binding protein [Ideonella azotifigens]
MPLFRLKASPRQEFDLLRWFSRISLAAAALVSVLLALGLAAVVQTLLLRHDAELSRQFVQSIVATQSVSRHFTSGPTPGREAALAEFFGHVAAMPDVLRANVYDRSGAVLWSSESLLTGRQFEDNDELLRSLRGETVVERGPVAAGDKAEHMALGPGQLHFVESYLPVYDAEQKTGGAPIGAVELYRVPTELNATLREAGFAVWSGTLISGLLLYLALLGFVRKASRQLQAQRERLIEAEAMARTGEIAASVAHSIRNPLASIRSSAELQLEIGEATPADARETIGHVDRIEHLVRTLLSYVQHPAEVRGSTDLAALLAAAEQRFAPVFQGQGKQLRLRTEPGLPEAHGEEVAIAQVLNSLLANALEATAAGALVEVNVERAGAMLALTVSDPGTGIAPERLAEVFKPFATTKPRGLGMGLTLARRTVDRLGGRIELSSRPGQTRATVLLKPANA